MSVTGKDQGMGRWESRNKTAGNGNHFQSWQDLGHVGLYKLNEDLDFILRQ